MKRSEQKEQRRIEILINALELFVQKGYAGTKASEIAKAVGVSEGLLFHYFPTKEALYLELVKHGVKATQVYPCEINDPYRAILSVISDFLTKTQANRRVAKMFVLMNAAQNESSTPEEVYKAASGVNIIQDSVSVIALGQQQGVFREGDPLTLSYTFWCAFDGIMVELARNPNMQVPEPKWLMSLLTK